MAIKTAVFVMLAGALMATPSHKPQIHVLHNFKGGSDGKFPGFAVALDAAGNLYGTTEVGGNGCSFPGGCGTIFELSPNGKGEWKESILHSFHDSADGGFPEGGLVFDKAGNFYGTADDGADNHGVVFEMSPDGEGGWNESILYNFQGGADGGAPFQTLAIDAENNLYGVTDSGGGGGCQIGCGVVFEVSPSGNNEWTESVLYEFTGDYPYPLGVVLDGSGNLYGTTVNGGDNGYGTAFELSPNGSGWNETVIYTFLPNIVGDFPAGPPVLDNAGNLYGGDDSTAYELSKNGTTWNGTILHGFRGGEDGSDPNSPLVFDAQGNLYGTTDRGEETTVITCMVAESFFAWRRSAAVRHGRRVWYRLETASKGSTLPE